MLLIPFVKFGQSIVIRTQAHASFERISEVLVHLTSLVFPYGIWLKDREYYESIALVGLEMGTRGMGECVVGRGLNLGKCWWSSECTTEDAG